MRTSRLLPLVLAATLAVSGCDILGNAFTSNKPKLPGQRISVLELEKQLEPDPGLASLQVKLPRPETNRDWPQSGGVSTHEMGHPALPPTLSVAWTESIGEGSSRYGDLLASPIVADGIVYTMDAISLVTAWKASDGTQLWQTDITPTDDDNQAWGGGIVHGSDTFVLRHGRIVVQTVAMLPAGPPHR